MSKLLNSWKEIACYIGRGVRTAQRWERDLGLPVRRPRHKDRSAVIAFSDEIDRWLKNGGVVARPNPRLAEAIARTERLHVNAAALAENVLLLERNIQRMMAATRPPNRTDSLLEDGPVPQPRPRQ